MLNKISLNNLTDFKKNVAIIFSGSVISQVILIFATPWLSRLYAPEEYGIYGVFISIALVTGSFSTFRYSQAIQITKEKDSAFKIFTFCKICVLSVSIILLFLLLIGYKYLLSFLEIERMGFYIFLLPVSTFFAGLIETYSTWLNRNKGFKDLAYNRVLISAITMVVAIVWAYTIDRSYLGLLVGSMSAQFIGILFLQQTSRRFVQKQSNFNWQDTKNLLQIYKKFPIYDLPAEMINIFTNQLPVFMLSRFAGSAEVGYFNMSNRVLGLPSLFIGNSFGEVFKQRATEDYHKYGTCRPIFLKTLKVLFTLAIFPFLIILFFGPELFSIVLGEQWKIAGEYSRILSVLIFFRFFSSPLSYIFFIAQKQKMNFLGHLLMLFGTTIPFYLGFIFFDNVMISIGIFSIAYSLVYVYYLYFSYRYSVDEVNIKYERI